jgi:hypothetical protein
VQAIKSPLPAAIAVFVCVLAVAGLYGEYVVNQNTPENAPAAEKVVVPPSPPPAPDLAVQQPAAPVEQIQPAIPVKGL